MDQLKALPVKKKGGANLREQLDVRRELWRDETLIKTKLKDMAKKADMLAAILAADQRCVGCIAFGTNYLLFLHFRRAANSAGTADTGSPD
jgi:hypothetical protein